MPNKSFESSNDPTNRIGKLRAANIVPTFVRPNDPISRAITIMLKNDFSHLPVMTSDYDVQGVISWPLIGSRLVLGKEPTEVRECMEQPNTVPADTSLFDAMDGILKNQYVLVRDKRRKICGIVGGADLSAQFRQLTEPFLLLGEIENQIRVIIAGGSFTSAQLRECRDPNDSGRVMSPSVNGVMIYWENAFGFSKTPQIGLKFACAWIERSLSRGSKPFEEFGTK